MPWAELQKLVWTACLYIPFPMPAFQTRPTRRVASASRSCEGTAVTPASHHTRFTLSGDGRAAAQALFRELRGGEPDGAWPQSTSVTAWVERRVERVKGCQRPQSIPGAVLLCSACFIASQISFNEHGSQALHRFELRVRGGVQSGCFQKDPLILERAASA